MEYHSTCRLCLLNQSNSERLQFIHIFNNNTTSDLPRKIYKYVDIKVEEDDGLPTCICITCLHVLLQFDNFKEKCHNSDNILRSMKAKSETTADLLSDCSSSINPKAETKVNREINTVNNVNDLQNSRTSFDNASIKALDDNSVENSKKNDTGDVSSSRSSLYAKKRKRRLTRSTHQEKYTECSNSNQPTLRKDKRVRLYKVDKTIRDIIGNNIYTCDVCNCKFTSFMEYYDHQETHEGQPVFKCSKCDAVFDERKLLLEHDLRHKISCRVCKLEVLPKSMAAHLLIHTDMHKCPQCGMRHTSNASLEKHVKARHAGIKGFVCHICGKQSSCQSSMNRHMAYHSNERPHKCKYCDFCAKSLNIVQVHTNRTHFAEKCVCEICAKVFKSQPSLLQHMKRIHTTRKHACNICGKTFIERYNLNRHLKRHANQRLHECKTCHKEFLTVRKLKEHRHSHREGCVNCPNCGKEFFYRKYLHKHLAKCSEMGSNSESFLCTSSSA